MTDNYCPQCGHELNKNKPVNIVCIMDRSGSMANMTDEMVGAFNQFVEDHKKLPGEANLTLVAFDNQYEVLFNKIPIQDVPALLQKSVAARGSTALNDAIGKTISGIPDNERTIVLIQTDGQENSSHEYKKDQVKALVEKKTAAGWEFVFIGAGIDAFSEGMSFGIPYAAIYNVSHDLAGTRDMYSTCTVRSVSYRSSDNN